MGWFVGVGMGMGMGMGMDFSFGRYPVPLDILGLWRRKIIAMEVV